MLHYQPRGGTGTRGSTTCFASGSSGSEAVRRGLGGLFLVGVALAQSGPSLQKEREAQQFMVESFGRPDFNEGVQSFLAKRPPDFQQLPIDG